MSQQRTYTVTDPAAVAAKVLAEGGPALDPTQPTGTASGDGVTIDWVESGSQITVTVESKPFLVPWSVIWAHLDALFSPTFQASS